MFHSLQYSDTQIMDFFIYLLNLCIMLMSPYWDLLEIEHVWKGVKGESILKPYVVIVRAGIKNTTRCLGVILDREWILTAGNCLHMKNGTMYPIEEMKIAAGLKVGKKPEQIHECYSVHCYSDFTVTTLGRHDLCLVQVVRPFLFNDYVATVTIQLKDWNEDTILNDCVTFRWIRKKPSFLEGKEVVAKRGLNACKCTKMNNVDTLVCVEDHAICFGEAGSPLLCDNKLVALAHAFAYGNCRVIWTTQLTSKECESEDSSGFFMYVHPYLTWMSKTANLPNIYYDPNRMNKKRSNDTIQQRRITIVSDSSDYDIGSKCLHQDLFLNVFCLVLTIV